MRGMSPSSNLGRLTVVPAREVWPHEALHFTPWLLSNVDVLSDLLGMDLVLEEAEHPVGGFSLDLIGYDQATSEPVIVENQLEPSDHTHLGQIITYAAGTNPTTIVWVTTGFRAEHRAAIDWLNERTDERTRVFGVVIQVVRIGDSEPAPNFELVAQPNDWEKLVKKATVAGSNEATARAMLYREFWEAVLDRIRAQHPPTWTRARTSDQNWCNTSVGIGGVNLAMVWTRGGLTAQIYFEGPTAEVNIARYEALYDRREAFEAALGEPAEWDQMEGRKAARVVVASPYQDVSARDQWPAIIDWLMDAQIRLRAALEAAGGTPTIAAGTNASANG
jgi:hypothetical protein